MSEPLTETQLDRLSKLLHEGAGLASDAMVRWLNVPSLVEIDSVEQLPFGSAVDLLGGDDETLCFCSMELGGALSGQLVLAFDDTSGLSLSDLLLDRPPSTAIQWGELERSAALETTNIIGCAYLNAISEGLSRDAAAEISLIPSPPAFRRDFAESLIQAAVMGQAAASDSVVIAQARFELRGQRLHWHLLFVPDSDSMDRLCELMESPT